jgi:starch synthase (maltosyl-transferring)
MKNENSPVLIYNLFPRLAGSFPRWKEDIDRAAEMKFTHLYVNPVLYPGFSGSLYSIKDYRHLNPLFVDTSDKKNEWDQFKEIINYTHEKGLTFIFDLVINHTAIDNPWTQTHPEWYVKDENGEIQRPFCMDNGKKIVWGDLAELNFSPSSSSVDELVKFWKEYISDLIRLGIDGFRCDAAYQIPADIWKEIISSAKMVNPEVTFFAETLGCPFEDIIELGKAGFDFSFNSSKYWNFRDPWALKQNNLNVGVTRSVSFPESHDTPRLAEELNGKINGIKMRYIFSALFSSGVMMPIGFEFAWRKKTDVVKTLPSDREETGMDLRIFIRRTNDLKRHFAIFSEDSVIEKVESGEGIAALLKRGSDGTTALIIINHDLDNYREFFHSDLKSVMGADKKIRDVSVEYTMESVNNTFHYNLRPGQVIVLLGEIRKPL